MFALLSQRNFFLLWAAHTISILGDYVFFIAITFWVYEQTNSASATGLVLITSTIPAVLFAPLAGVTVDRWDRRCIMLVAESSRAILFLGLLGVVIVQPHALWPIYIVGFVQSALAAFFWPARSALLPQMVEPPSLLAANALYMVSDGAVRVIAPTLSTFMLFHLGSPGVIIVDAMSFVISVGCVCLLTTAPLQHDEAVSLPRRRQPFAILASSGENAQPPQDASIPAKRERRIHVDAGTWYRISGPLILGAIIAYTAGTLNILLPIFVRTMLSSGPLAFGWMLTAQAIGEGTMSVLLGRTRTRRRHLSMIVFVSGCLTVGGLTLIIIAYMHMLLPGLVLSLIFGAVTAAMTVQLLTFLQQRTTNRLLGRVLATYTAIQALAQVGGMGVASAVAVHVGVMWLLAFDGALYLLGSALVWLLLK